MTKSRFTTTELRAIHNQDFFHTKATATEKIDSLLSKVRDEIKYEIKKNKLIFPKEADVSTGKIFRGESYLGLPYLVLDYPKHFSKDSVCSCRTMFWWGNFFSFTLHLEGIALEEKRSVLINNWRKLRKKNIYICIHPSPWHYYYSKGNYISIDRLSESEIKQMFISNKFIKLSRKIDLKEYKKLRSFSRESFTMITSFLFCQDHPAEWPPVQTAG